MLSFLRDQGSESLGGRKTDAAAKGDTDMLKNNQGLEYLTVAGQGRSARKSTILVIVLFVVGLLCLLYMIRKVQPQAASAAPVDTEETQIEVAISRLTGVSSEMLSRMDQIVKKFYEFSSVLQVRVNELVKNPFEVEMFLNSLEARANDERQNLEIDDELLRQQQLRQQVKSLQLLCIMQSDRGNCCMIDDRILHEGDSIRGFRIREIGNDFAKLRWEPEYSSEASQDELQSLDIVLKLSE